MADTNQQPPPAQLGPVQFLMSNKLETAMWLSRLFTVYCSVMFILPVLGAVNINCKQKLHITIPMNVLIFVFIFNPWCPVSIFPVFLFSLLHATTYTKKVLDSMGPSSLMFIRNLLDKLSANQQNILKFIACNEIFLMPATVFMLFSGQGSLLLPFIYYRFLTLRYTSRRNPYCRTLFTELRILLEHFIMKPACPAFFRRMCLSSIAFISRLAPTGV
ncbi:unnamed protein product [Menidia menidia]|uniref:(Atlantic silverside) hypothetical protein n=2 Tax=Menidia menidia TaxID=238744 RepID=A0A8S4BFT7_9TELE|nr:unnamed protein product [Menidia menidia]